MATAVAARHQAEREWLSRDSQGGDAFSLLARTEAAYLDKIGRFGAYTVPAAERDAAFEALIDARAGDSETAAREAEKVLIAANARVEAAEARLRNGNPAILKAYDDWQEARRTYSGLRMSAKAISEASENVTQLLAKRHDLNVRNEKEN